MKLRSVPQRNLKNEKTTFSTKLLQCTSKKLLRKKFPVNQKFQLKFFLSSLYCPFTVKNETYIVFCILTKKFDVFFCLIKTKKRIWWSIFCTNKNFSYINDTHTNFKRLYVEYWRVRNTKLFFSILITFCCYLILIIIWFMV